MKDGLKIFIYSILYILFSVIIIYISQSYNKKVMYRIIEDTKQIDTIYIEYENKDSIIKLNTVVDSLKSENFILQYKLGRVKEYNDIAAKGNNIKYLRGWINRVLNE